MVGDSGGLLKNQEYILLTFVCLLFIVFSLYKPQKVSFIMSFCFKEKNLIMQIIAVTRAT